MGPTLAYEYAIVDRFPAPDWLTDAPSLAALDDGTLICAVPVIVMPRHHEGSFATHYRATLEQLGMGTLHLYRSTDGGVIWTRLPERLDFLCGRLFRIGNDLYYLGVGHERRDAWLTRSRDGGMTWSARTRIAAGRFYAAASGMVADSGRLCWALGMANVEDEFNGTGSRVVALAADSQRDLLNERTWRMSAPLTYPGTPASLRLPVPLAPGYRDHFLEPNVVEVAGGVRVILRCRIDHYATSHLAAVCDVEDDGTRVRLRFRQFQPFPGAQNHFFILADECSGLLWMASNLAPRSQDAAYGHELERRGFLGSPGNERRILMLWYGVDALTWFPAGCIAMSANPMHAFNYVSLLAVGDDLLVASRTALHARNQHDNDLVTVHRIPRFRELALDLTPQFAA